MFVVVSQIYAHSWHLYRDRYSTSFPLAQRALPLFRPYSQMLRHRLSELVGRLHGLTVMLLMLYLARLNLLEFLVIRS